ncbi:acetyltransferase [Salinimicrobium soli]|uniref:acetyltransferase n=1 Tax=Salinimicrobium soli TaxID=1254399 RepID=UPI003AAFAB2C
MSNKKVVLVGFSGHGIVVADAALEQGLEVMFYTDKQPVEENPFNLKYLGFEADPEFKFWNQEYRYALAIGNNGIRRKTAETILKRGKELVNIIHPHSFMSKWVNLGIGVFVNNNAAVNAKVTVGNYCIINTGSIVDHECRLGDAVHIAPGAVLAGAVIVGDNTFIGANSVIKEGVRIGKNVVIGAGSVIIDDVADNVKIVGNPGREI